jgi:hypothetical protein
VEPEKTVLRKPDMIVVMTAEHEVARVVQGRACSVRVCKRKVVRKSSIE